MLSKINTHEVYAVYNSLNQVIYIGSGANNRHKHCQSGCSHVYELNRMHFNNETFETKLLRTNLSKEDSLKIEQDLILFHKPKLNKQYTVSDARKISMYEGKLKRDFLLEIINSLGHRCIVLDRFKHSVLELLDSYKVQGLISGVRIKSRLIHLIRGKDSLSKREMYFNTIFEYRDGILKLNQDTISKLDLKFPTDRNLHD